MSTSGTYLSLSPQSVQIIEDAYERIGIIPSKTQLSDEQIYTAQRSINFCLSSWINKGLNLWTVRQSMIALTANQAVYPLPDNAIDILEATIRTSTRNLGGTPFSSNGGIASNAFDNNPNTACTQNAINGYISYSWGMAQYAIAMVGIQSNQTITYTLVFEYSNDNITWNQVGSPISQTYTMGINKWFVISIPTLGKYFRVRETGGSILNIQELYFNTLLYDTIITRLSRSEYVAIPNKNQPGRPSSFYVDRQIIPTVSIWNVPTQYYNNMYFTYTNAIQDIGSMINNAEIPARFLEALCSDLAFRLSIKNPDISGLDKSSMLLSLSKEEYTSAANEDSERVPLRIYPDYTQGWGQI